MATPRLPEGRHFALTWTVPEVYGGQTSSMLHRSRAFVRLAGVTVDVLTFDPRTDYPALEQRLRDHGELIDGMRLRSLWDDLRERHVAPRSEPPGTIERVFTPLDGDPSYRSEARDGAELLRARIAADGETVLQLDHYRSDGSLLLSDRRDTRQRGTVGGRSLVLCDRTGRPVRSWGRSRALYAWWIDRLTKGADAYLLADSRPIAEFLLAYRKPGRVTVHIVHGSHLDSRIGAWGLLRPTRAAVFRNLGALDSVVFLTDRQRRDAQLLLGRQSNLAVIPNSRALPPVADSEAPRAASGGIMLCALTSLKRVDHGIRAVALARTRTPDLRLDIYGDGPERAHLEAVITATGEHDAIRLRGYSPEARSRLSEASFLLMTSRNEGFGLVLLEAMAAGCIPIAYDVPYGPAELIEHGRNGFLVRSGSVPGLAKVIVRLQRMTPEAVAELRRNARRTAERYSDEAVLPLWAAELAAARERNRRTTSG